MWLRVRGENNLINTERVRRLSVKRAAGSGAKTTYKLIASSEEHHYTLYASDKEGDCVKVLDDIFKYIANNRPCYDVPSSKIPLSR